MHMQLIMISKMQHHRQELLLRLVTNQRMVASIIDLDELRLAFENLHVSQRCSCHQWY